MTDSITSVTNLELINFIDKLYNLYSDKQVNIVTNWRGGVPIAVHLNNILENSTLSLLKYQTYKGQHKDQNSSTCEMVINEWSPDCDVTIFVDDIYDTGESSKVCVSFMKDSCYKLTEVEEHYLVSRSPDKECGTLVTDGAWVKFPWEL